MAAKRGILQRLEDGEVIVGDGSYLVVLETRGYVKAGPWTPEVNVEHPEAVLQLSQEFLRAGADVIQAFTFNATEDKLENRGYTAIQSGFEDINRAGCEIAVKTVAGTDALVAGSISQTPAYQNCLGKDAVQKEVRKQAEYLIKYGCEFIIAEYYEFCEELEWTIEELKKFDIPVGSCMSIAAEGDGHGLTPEECAVRLAKAGADIIGVNCRFDPETSLKTMKLFKNGLEKAGIKKHLMVQPIIFRCPEATIKGFIDLPDFPFALEPRVCTRFEIQKFAREAYNMGIRYIGGCCGFQPYHIRGIAEELAVEKGKLPKASDKHEPWGTGLRFHTHPMVRARANKEHWETLEPATGRPFSAAASKPDEWDYSLSGKGLAQPKHETTKKELTDLKEKKEQRT